MAIAAGPSSSGDISGATATTTIIPPFGISATDVLIAVFGSGRTATTNQNAVTPPAGWTSINTAIGNNNGTDEVNLAAFWALGNIAAFGFGNSQTSTLNQGWVCLSFSGVDNITPIDALATPSSNTGAATITCNSLTIVTTGAIHVVPFADHNKQTSLNLTGYSVTHNGASNQSAFCSYNTTAKTAGDTLTGTVLGGTSSGQILAVMPFALRPNATAVSRAPAAGSLTLTGTAPSLMATSTRNPAAGALVLTGSQPLIAGRRVPNAGNLSLDGATPALLTKYNLSPSAGALTLSGAAPTVQSAIAGSRAPIAGALTLSGQTPSMAKGGPAFRRRVSATWIQ